MDLIGILVDPPADDREDWAAHLVIKFLRSTSGRYFSVSSRERRTVMERIYAGLHAAFEVMTKEERILFAYVLLLHDWVGMKNSSGVLLAADRIMEVIQTHLSPAEYLRIVEDVLERGDGLLTDYPYTDEFASFRRDNLIRMERIWLAEPSGDGKGRFVIPVADPLQCAFVHVRVWVTAYLRYFMRWRLSALDDDDRRRSLDQWRRRMEKPTRLDRREERIILGLLDWLIDHPQDPGAEAILELTAACSFAPIRKQAIGLASAMDRFELLDRISKNDGNRAIRTEALKFLRERGRTSE